MQPIGSIEIKIDEEAKELKKIIASMLSLIEQKCYEVSEKLGQESAEHAYDAVTFAMLTRVCTGLAEDRGQEAFKNYWKLITEVMTKVVEQIDCKQTRH